MEYLSYTTLVARLDDADLLTLDAAVDAALAAQDSGPVSDLRRALRDLGCAIEEARDARDV